MAWSRASKLAALAATVFAAAAPVAADDLPTEFSRQITALTGDWEAEDWREGTIKAHPEKYTWQSDTYLILYAEEPAAGRTALDIARTHFDGFSLDDDTLEPTLVDMTGAEPISPGVIGKPYIWSSGFDTNFSMFGVVLRSDGRAIPYYSNCEIPEADADPDYSYSQEACIEGIGKILITLQGSSGVYLFMPDAEAPLMVAGWRNSYVSSGVSMAINANFYGTRQATLMVSPPLDIAADSLSQTLTGFSENLVDEFDDQTKEHPGITTWVGNADDPWLRREFPEAFDGPSIVMAGAQKGPNGKTYLVGIRCPNSNWQASCAHGVDQALSQVRSGVLEERRQKIIAAGQQVLPDNGATADQVMGAFLQGSDSWVMGSYQYRIDGPLLFTNGDAYTCFEGPLGAIVVSDSKAQQPDCWGKWTRDGESFAVVWDDGDLSTISVEGAMHMVGGDATTRIDGHYRYISVGGSPMMGSSYMNESNYYFSGDGTFSSDSSSSFSVTTGNPLSPDATASGASSGSGPQGRYEVNGYDMKLTFPDGRIQWVGFGQLVDEVTTPAKTSLLIDGTYFYRDDD